MSFSSQTKNQLAQLKTANPCCRLAEFLALIKTTGHLSLNAAKGLTLTVVTENAAVAKRIFKLSKALFEHRGKVAVYRKNSLKKNHVYAVEIPAQPGVDEIFVHLGLLDAEGHWQNHFHDSFPTQVLTKNCCQRAYLRGAFLGSGSVNHPEKSYHLEIVCGTLSHGQEIKKILAGFEVTAKICQRKHQWLLYLKDGEQIVSFLVLIGAHQGLFVYENERIRKELCNNVNRQENFDMANMDKIVNASVEQRLAIEKIKNTLGLEQLSPRLREIAQLRLDHPESSLGELAELVQPPMSKSGARHRLKKLAEIAENL